MYQKSRSRSNPFFFFPPQIPNLTLLVIGVELGDTCNATAKCDNLLEECSSTENKCVCKDGYLPHNSTECSKIFF